MNEALNYFIGKECLVYMRNNNASLITPSGIVKAIDGKWLMLQTGKEGEENINMFNTEHIMRIREYPIDKRGKKKSIIAD